MLKIRFKSQLWEFPFNTLLHSNDYILETKRNYMELTRKNLVNKLKIKRVMLNSTTGLYNSFKNSQIHFLQCVSTDNDNNNYVHY